MPWTSHKMHTDVGVVQHTQRRNCSSCIAAPIVCAWCDASLLCLLYGPQLALLRCYASATEEVCLLVARWLNVILIWQTTCVFWIL